MSSRKISVSEISQHDKDTDCWIVVDDDVWDITAFAPEHPGGPGIIYRYAGRDATEAYNEIHAPSIIKTNLPSHAFKGVLDRSTGTDEWQKASQPDASQRAPARTTSAAAEKAPLESLINAHDFELAAKSIAKAKTWAFYSSAANDLITRDANASMYQQIFFRPRVMRKVDKITTNTTLLGSPITFPLLISPAAMARLIHPDGELAIGRAAKSRNIIQAISNNASFSASDIVSQRSVKDHPFWFQLYVNRIRSKSDDLIREITAHKNITAIMVTTDAAAPGKREADERVKADESIVNPMQPNKVSNDKKGGGYGRLMAGGIDPDLHWADIKWLRSQTSLPLMLKGIMSADDVVLALHHGLEGVMLSNHGGRNLDTSPPAILVLLEIHARYPWVIRDHHPNSASVRAGTTKPFSILVDGGVRRGSDILKAVCLGAVGVGIGRPALFATAYGQEGVESLIDILRDEFETAMRNCGLISIDECGPEYVNTGLLDSLVSRSETHPYAASFNARRKRNSKL